MVEVCYLCPICKGELQPSGEELRCAACDLSFQRKDGIFRLHGPSCRRWGSEGEQPKESIRRILQPHCTDLRELDMVSADPKLIWSRRNLNREHRPIRRRSSRG